MQGCFLEQVPDGIHPQCVIEVMYVLGMLQAGQPGAATFSPSGGAGRCGCVGMRIQPSLLDQVWDGVDIEDDMLRVAAEAVVGHVDIEELLGDTLPKYLADEVTNMPASRWPMSVMSCHASHRLSGSGLTVKTDSPATGEQLVRLLSPRSKSRGKEYEADQWLCFEEAGISWVIQHR